MSLTALLLVLAAAAIHATWNYQLKKANATRVFWPMAYFLALVVSLPLLLYFDPDAFTRVTPVGWLVILISAPVHVCYAYVLQHGYKVSDYSIVYPTARGMGPFITVIAAVVILDNRPSTMGAIGIACILLGVVFLAMKSGTSTDAARVKKGLFWGIVTGCCIAGYSFCDAWAVQQTTGLTPYSFYFPSILVRVLILLPVVFLTCDWKKEIKDIFTDPVKRKAVFIVAAGSPGGYILVLIALTMAPLAYVAPGREVGMMAGAIVGAILLKEKLTPFKLLGFFLMVTGIILIALAK